MKLIDADALIVEINKGTIVTGDIYGLGIMTGIDKALRMVREAPTINPEDLRPKGEWIAETDRTGNYSHCSECGCRCRGYAPNYKYCPNCGAKMEG